MFCHKCGTQVHENALFCPNCGEKLITDEIAQENIPQSYAVDTVQQEATQYTKTKRISPKAVVLFCILAAAIVVIIVAAIFLNRQNDDSPEDMRPEDADVSFTGEYTNSEEGISFNYPSNWTMLDSDELDDNVLVYLVDSAHNATFLIHTAPKGLYDAGIGDYSKQELQDEFYDAYSSDASVDVSDFESSKILLSSITAGKLSFSFTNEYGVQCNTIQYVYNSDDTFYYVTMTTPEAMHNDYLDTFKAIMYSYTITGISQKQTSMKSTDKTVKRPATIDDAMEIFEKWETTHPLDSNLSVSGGFDDVDSGVFRLFLFDYEYGYEYGAIEVDKSDGSMKIVIDFIKYDLDDWYDGRTFEDDYNWDDEYYIDGNFEWVELPNIRTDYLYGTAFASYIEGVVRNTSGSTKNPVITFILYDSNWNQIGTATDITSHLADGATWKFSAYYSSDAAFYEFYEIR